MGEVGPVRQQLKPAADLLDHGPHKVPLWEPRLSMMTMSPKIRVGTRNCSDPGVEGLAGDGTIDHLWGGDGVVPQCGEEGAGLPVAVRDGADQPLAMRRVPAVGAAARFILSHAGRARRS
jgi:hypothetical protein